MLPGNRFSPGRCRRIDADFPWRRPGRWHTVRAEDKDWEKASDINVQVLGHRVGGSAGPVKSAQ